MLANHLNVEAVRITELEGLRTTAITFWMGSLLGGPRATDLPPDEAAADVIEQERCWTSWYAVVDRLDVDAYVEDEARSRLEQRFFGGRDVLFPDAAKAWDQYVGYVALVVRTADRLQEAKYGEASQPSAGDAPGDPAVEARIDDRVAWLIDDAKVRAYETLGERLSAVPIQERRLMAVYGTPLPDPGHRPGQEHQATR